MSDDFSAGLAGSATLLVPPEGRFVGTMRTWVDKLADASGPHLDTGERQRQRALLYANPATAKPSLPRPIRRRSRRPVRRYRAEDWPYAPEADCQKDWDDAGE
jgi:hypothetical protein